jgi:hypothetical protein
MTLLMTFFSPSRAGSTYSLTAEDKPKRRRRDGEKQRRAEEGRRREKGGGQEEKRRQEKTRGGYVLIFMRSPLAGGGLLASGFAGVAERSGQVQADSCLAVVHAAGGRIKG